VTSGEILSSRLARYFCGVTFNDLNADHVVKMKVFLLDWVSSAYAGKDLPPIQMIRKVARSLDGTPEATSIPDGVKTSCLLASLVNGASSHIVEMDDLHRESILHPAIDLLGSIDPKTPYLAKFNLPFCVATALRYGHVQPGDFTPARLEDKDQRQLMKKIKVASDPDLTGTYPRKWPARVTIILKDGRRLDGANEYPKGDPQNPLLERELITKFKSLTEGTLPSPKADAIIDRVLGLESMGDVNDLLK
jgi:2-methylcitrate dehydratase PrpD